MSGMDAKKIIMQLNTYKTQFISSLLPVVGEAEAQSFFLFGSRKSASAAKNWPGIRSWL